MENFESMNADMNSLVSIITPTYNRIKGYIDQGAFRPFSHRTILDSKTDDEIEKENKENRKLLRSVYMSMLLLIGELYALKSMAFKEEVEWRLISLFMFRGAGDVCSFSVTADRIKPYRSFKLDDLGVNAIEEIVLGPKNATPADIIDSFLKQNGF